MAEDRIAVLGAGTWGTALAHHLRSAGYSVTIWSIEPEVRQGIRAAQGNPRYLVGEKLCPGIEVADSPDLAAQSASLVVFSVPSDFMRETARAACKGVSGEALVVNTAKGLEEGSLKRMSEVLAEELGNASRIAVLSGPSFALEVVRGLPTAVTVAAAGVEVAGRAAHYFHHHNFRVYTSQDVVGVELGGAIKNVIALAAGIVDGAGMGLNARAALLTRGLAELQRVIVALGGQSATVMGLSGLGDLLLTATGDLSRNRQVGFRLGQGECLQDILASLGQVAEGVSTTHKVLALARGLRVSVPIADEVERVLNGESSVAQSVRVLLSRAPRSEIPD